QDEIRNEISSRRWSNTLWFGHANSLALEKNPKLSHAAGPSSEKIYQYILREIARICEVGFAVRHRAHLFHELNQVVVAGQHERVDHYTGFSTSLDFFESRLHHKRVAAHRILVQTARW